MLVGNEGTLDENYVNTITITEPNHKFHMMQSDNLKDSSSMVTPNLTPKQREKLLEVLQKSAGFFEQSRKSKDIKGKLRSFFLFSMWHFN
ncbi:hypothetical protein AVEN_211569-1 [Araneus ventricosus]|uniref:Uncharacterized protein n=1 Tax=Araneus ventricosus TaxID=182803 RepID=A0A4Y2D9Y8_ARAVE|nr:hypothetical protein AVEN_211569-1 [Araneus ventricosus]